MMKSIEIKKPSVQTAIHPLIQKRWSPLSFANQSIAEAQMEELFEAASWAASAYNEQPWQYVYAHRGTEGFEQLWSCLNEGNQPWTKAASVLFAAIQSNTFSKTGKPNHWASHDLGMANAQLLLQAVHRDIYGHLMAGFDPQKLSQLLNLEEGYRPVCMGALGYLGDAEAMTGTYKTREQSPRSRKPVSTFTKRL
ncbi:MAG: nitroreductase family protein [Bacteroidota bacterium]